MHIFQSEQVIKLRFRLIDMEWFATGVHW